MEKMNVGLVEAEEKEKRWEVKRNRKRKKRE